ncbi:MAG: hypothetical protein LUC38_05475 [Oscillospiraceae bacterium]|nr:hypothetical protein [Ruminococcus sp.]MCD8345397.1 hypothetical protein [Oscillospiraceae bacterium]
MSKYKNLREMLEDVLTIIEGCDTVEEAVEKLKALLDEMTNSGKRTKSSSNAE